ncbi:MAG: hypothetical protein IKX36_04465 [Prevotella sp.]|nr:hypothetical protein [Prevotella sp.]
MKRLLILMLTMLLVSTSLMAQKVWERYAWEGTLNGKISIRLAIEVNDVGIVAGSICYYKAKNAKPILVVGDYNENAYIFLSEYLPDGTVTGYISIQVKNGLPVGTWTNPKTEQEYTFQGMRKIAFPAGYGGKLTPENPGNIGQYYGYSIYNKNMEDYTGGHFKFRGAGKNKIHFDATNVPRNIAEGQSEKGRPAVLNGNHFVYNNVNECGYGFEAYFYPQFMVARNISDYDTFDCFGMGATLSGVYIKKKQ